MFNGARHAVEMLKDAIYVNHLLIQMLEEFSKGRVLTVKTQRTTMRKKKKQADTVGAEDSYEGSEESEQEHVIERQFNFLGELTILVDYEVIRKYMLVLTHPSLREDVDMLRMFAGFCKRVMFQFKQPWVFFTLETLGLFDAYLKRQGSNNSLLMGLQNDFGCVDKRLAVTQQMVTEVVQQIVSKFMVFQSQNPFLAIEALCRFTSQTQINQALNNYYLDGGANAGETINLHNIELAPSDNEEECGEQADEPQQVTGKWTHEDDLVLIDNYPKFKSLGKKQCFAFLAELLDGKDNKDCYNRYKELKLKHLTPE